jgi:hypothetical protein
MKATVQKLIVWFRLLPLRLACRVPTWLPIGVKAFDEWCSSIFRAYPQFPDNDTMRFALATMILHRGETSARIPRHFFAICLHKSASNQVVAQFMQDVKAKYEELAKQEKAAATASAEAANGQK